MGRWNGVVNEGLRQVSRILSIVFFVLLLGACVASCVTLRDILFSTSTITYYSTHRHFSKPALSVQFRT